VLSDKVGARVYLKLDNAQQTGSFKIRGIGKLCQNAVAKGCAHILASSGGNAGLAAAYAARKLGVPATIVVPSTTAQFMREKIAAEGAKVVVHGDVLADAHKKALELNSTIPNSFVVHPFDHPDVWEGNSSIIKESAAMLDKPPNAIICVVGGGGLFCGIMQGLKSTPGWENIPVLACETFGANKFALSVESGQLVTVDKITSIAKTLGANRVTEKAFEWTKQHKVINCLFSDEDVVSSILEFQRDHQMLVEPSCAAGLAVIYEKDNKYLSKVLHLSPNKEETVLVIVCGGSMVNLDLIEQWKLTLKLNEKN